MTGLALLGDVPPDLLAALAAGGAVPAGAVADVHTPVTGERWGGALQVLAAAEAGRVRAALVAPEAARLLPDLLGAGLPVLLAPAAPWDPELLRECRELAEDVPAGVLLRERAAGWAVAADRALAEAGERSPEQVPVQVVVRGWPQGGPAAAGLVDLLRRWCGDVAAVCAAAAALPAAALPGGEPVAWALLGERGTTVLVAHEGAGPQVRVSLPDRRLVTGPAGTAWSDGAPVARVRPGLPVIGLGGHEELPWTAAEQLAAGLVQALRCDDPEVLGGGHWPWPPGLGDLQPVARVLAALGRSSEQGRWVELG